MAIQAEKIETNELFIGGEWVAPQGNGRIDVVSPSTEEPIGPVPEGSDGDIDAAVRAARAALPEWSGRPVEERVDALMRLAQALEARGEDTAQRVSMQNGMPISVSRQLEAVFPAVVARYYAGLIAETDLEEDRAGLLGGRIRVVRKPIGVVGAIVPWNYPQTLAMFKLAPALAAGCTIVMKPSPETVLDSLVLADAIVEAQIPAGVVSIVPAGREVGAYLVSHPGIDKIAFTGSTAAGRKIATTCGELLRPVTVELGGKSAAIVLDDADLSDAAEALFAGMAGALRLGDALDPETQIGPMVSARQRDRVEGYIEAGRAEGARVVAGGGRPADQDRGFFVEPTIFADVKNGHRIAREEIFGPVLSVIPYGTEEEALELANHNDLGLGGSVWTSDVARGEAVAKRVQTGTIGINSYRPDPAAPFGGLKDSGLGRELGPEGLVAYPQLQSIYRPS
jgi:aldehyde dehydrogenase (NAD+)